MLDTTTMAGRDGIYITLSRDVIISIGIGFGILIILLGVILALCNRIKSLNIQNTSVNMTPIELDQSKGQTNEEQLYAEIEDPDPSVGPTEVSSSLPAPEGTISTSHHYDDVVLNKPNSGDYHLTLCAAYGMH